MLKTDQEYRNQIKQVGKYNLKDTHKWRERAIFFNENGYYTDLIEDTKDWDDFWDEEEKRIQEGLWVDGVYIPGLYYFYLNYLPIYKKQENTYDFPDVYDMDYHTFLCLEHAVFLKLDFVVIKKRQCIDKDTFIYTPLGVETIENLCNSNYRGEVFSLDENKKLIVDEIIDIWKTKEVRELIKITLTGGKTLECTDEHKINTNKGWVKAGELKVKDVLYTITPPFGENSISDSEAISMGYFFADGSYSQKNISPKFTNTNQNYLDDFEYHFLEWQKGCAIRKNKKGNGFDYVITNKERNKGKSNPFKKYLFAQGLCSKDENRIISEKYMNLDERSTSLMINRIFAGDGWLSRLYNKKSNSYRYELGIGSMSLKFLNQLSFLLSKYNISCSIKEQPPTKKQKKPFYKLRIYKTSESEKFLDKIGIYKKDENLVIVKSYNNRENTSQIKKIEVIKKESIVYDLETKSTSSFFANGIHIHNCGFTLKFCVPLIREIFFSRGSPNYIATYEEAQVLKAWSEVIEPYREHVNTHTPWYRDFNPSKPLNWRAAKEVIDEHGRKLVKGRKNTLKGLVLSKSASKGVGGGATWIFGDESGVNPVLSKFKGYINSMMYFGNVKTGTVIFSGAVGELKHLEAGLKDYMVDPEKHGFYSVDNIWDKDNEFAGRKCGFFVPESWAYFGVDDDPESEYYGQPFIDEYGNSFVVRAEEYIKKRRLGLIPGINKEADKFDISQAPLNLAECFQYRGENVFPLELLQPQIEKVDRKELHGVYVDLYETSSKEIKHKILDKYTYRPILEHPIDPTTKDKDGVIQVWEFPPPNKASYGVYWAGVDIVRDSISVNSPSLNVIHIYKGSHNMESEYKEKIIVAKYMGRPKDKMDWFKKAIMLMEWYNAEALVENNVNWFIEEAIKIQKQHKIAKTPQWVKDMTPQGTSYLTKPYGVVMTPKLMEKILDSVAKYLKEPLHTEYNEETGEPTIHYGVERINDLQLLRELVNYRPKKDYEKGNYDSLISFGLSLLQAEYNEVRGIIPKDTKENANFNQKSAKLMLRNRFSHSNLKKLLNANNIQQ